MENVEVQPSVFKWAINRSRKEAFLYNKFPKLSDWIDGESSPTLRQLENFAKSTSTPLGYFFLKEPPNEIIPVPHYRTLTDDTPENASSELIDTLHIMQRRQGFMKDFFSTNVGTKLKFVGLYDGDKSIELAKLIIELLELKDRWASTRSNWHEALKYLIGCCERKRITTMLNGVVGSNNARKLDVNEFRGFVLVDEIAPLIFINSSDSKAAQIFTLIHEVAHILVGQSAIVEASPTNSVEDNIESLCNKAAAEVLCPREVFIDKWKNEKDINIVAKYFKVSSTVVARRALELDLISIHKFYKYLEEIKHGLVETKGLSGGNFYSTTSIKLGRTFTEIVRSEVSSGKLLHRDAYRLTGLNGETFKKYMDYSDR